MRRNKTCIYALAAVIIMVGVILPFGSWSAAVAEAADEPLLYEAFEYVILEDGTIEITGYSGSAADVALPETINGTAVTSIGYCAFLESKLTSVAIPDSVTTIGACAFFACAGLTDIALPESLTDIGDFAFAACLSLQTVTIPAGVTSIGESAFYACIALEGFAVEQGNVCYSAYEGILYNQDWTELIYCPEGKTGEAQIPEGVETIRAYAFEECNLTSVTVPESVTEIGEGAFDGYGLLTISGYTGSVAQTYAVEHEIAFIALDLTEIPYGDVNGDGAVDTKDVVLLKRYVAGWKVGLNKVAGDVNVDGKLDTKDVVLMKRCVAGWSVTLGA